MSQHRFNTEHNGRPICVLAGWDRPLQGCFMIIEYLDSDAGEMLYSNLDDVDSHPPSFAKFLRVLGGHGIRIPDDMAQAIKMDIEVDRGNHCEDWTGTPVDEAWPELKCANCGRTSTVGWLAAERIQQRHELGDTYSDKECPECGALAFPLSKMSAPKVAIESVLVVSTAHITERDSVLMDEPHQVLPLSIDEYGYFLRSIDGAYVEKITRDYSESMRRVVDLAKANDCHAIRFDRDGPVYDAGVLPIHDW